MNRIIDLVGGDLIFAVGFFLLLFVGYRYFIYKTTSEKRDDDTP